MIIKNNRCITVKSLWLIVPIVLSLTTTACIFDPRLIPKKPVQVPTQWNSKDKEFKLTEKHARCIAWWRQFEDPVLDNLIKVGLKNNNDIQVAISNIKAAEGELKRVKLNWFPNLGSLLGYSSFPYLGYPGVIAVLFPKYTINILNQISEQKKAKLELKITENMRDTIKLAVIAQISGSYFNYLGQIEQLHLLEKVDRDLTEKMNIYQSTYENELASDINLAKAKSKLDLIKAQEKVIQKNIVISQNMLRYLLNENPEEFVFNRQFRQLNSHQTLVGSLPVDVIENRPDMMQATHEFQAANAGIGIAVSQFLPTFDLAAARGDIGTMPNGTTLGKPVYFNQGLLESPLITPASFGEWEKSRGFAKAAYYHYVDTLRKILRDVDSDLATHAHLTERLDDTIRSKNHQKTAYTLKNALYHEGIISYSKLLNEKIKYDEIQITVNQHKIEQLISIVTLYQDLAVGYGCS